LRYIASPSFVLGSPLSQVDRAFFAQAAFVTAVMPVDLLCLLLPGQFDRPRVDDHDVVAHIDEGHIGRLVLALQQPSRQGCHTPEHLPVGVDDVPPAVGALRARHERTHEQDFLRPAA
jgi:hypothetical protein